MATIKRWLGWATADREVEAEGRAEERVGTDPPATAVEDALDDVRTEAGEIPEGAPGAEPRDT